ncbi:RodZ domain-containing protein [Conservatibacter flavescens]|uniref:DUF4115 domain-containing protein n=1 Tax=Conservatibacter flavescens TaxID=28161 RepID=A0A2M8S0L5_9PAST|nr:RodZ family helix-turn-helix domain-containing protein [Conservatibacter flavescens]PJG84693.1 DUF4115 domain-containing protein [Conservatibacter flavescens]
MNNPTNSPELAPVSLGEHCRQAREALGLSLDDVSEKINLRTTILQHIENDEFIHPAIPATFMRGYVRSYAKFLRLPEHLLNTVSYGEAEKNDLGKNTRAKKAVNNHSSHGRWVSYLTWLILLIVIGMTLLWWWQNHQKTTAERDNLVENYVATTNNASVTEQTENVLVKENHSTDEVVATDSTNTVAAPVDLQPITSVNTTESEVLEPTTSTEALQSEMNRIDNAEENSAQESSNTIAEDVAVLRIEITGTSCWISVRDGNRKVLAEKEYRQGEVLTFNEGENYSLIIGAPGNVKISYQGKDVPLKVDGRVARFKLPQQ